MTSAPESMFTFYDSEMDPQVNDLNLSNGNTDKAPTLSWQSLPEYPDTLPEMRELISLFQQATEDIFLITKITVWLHDSIAAKKQPEWLNSAEVLEILRISKRTLQDYRNKHRIAFTRIGGKVFYNRKVVMGMLNQQSSR